MCRYYLNVKTYSAILLIEGSTGIIPRDRVKQECPISTDGHQAAFSSSFEKQELTLVAHK